MDHLEKIEKRKWIFPDSDSRKVGHTQLYIVAVSFIGGGNRGPTENHQPVASH
jgi:hypothetical protein